MELARRSGSDRAWIRLGVLSNIGKILEIKAENHKKSESNQEPTPECLSEIEEDDRNEETAEIDANNYSDYEMPQPHFENYESFGDTYASDEDFMAGQETDLFENNREMLEIEDTNENFMESNLVENDREISGDPSVDVTNLSRTE